MTFTIPPIIWSCTTPPETDLYQKRAYSIDLRFGMEWDDFNQFVDPNDLQNGATVPAQDLAWDLQPGVPGDQDDFSANNLADTTQTLPSLPTSNNRGRLPPMSTSRGPMRILGSRPPNTTLTKAGPQNLPPGAATAPTLPRTRALAKAKLMSTQIRSTQPAWHGAVRPAPPPTQANTAGVQQTLLQHISTLQGRVRTLENHVDALNKTLERWDPDTWECLREMVQEMVQEHVHTDGET